MNIDHYDGQPGTFYNDPATGLRVPEAEWLAKQEAKAKPKSADKTTPKPDATGE